MRHKYLISNLLLFALMLFAGSVFAQNGSITGKVLDTKRESLPGVSVTVDGTTIGTATDIDGVFKLNGVSAGQHVLIARYLGYTTQRKTVNVVAGQAVNIEFLLAAETQSLNEVVVIGYGTQTRKDVTGSVATVTSKDFQKGTISTPEQLIAGKVAGVSVVSNGGAPGSGSTIKVRAGASLSASNSPLYVIDGVPLEGSTVAGAPSPLSMINPDDIESFTVLKDASSTAIYGSRASGGVILITTKKGASGKPQVNFTTQYSLSKIPKKVDVLSAGELRDYVNANGTDAEKALLGSANTDWQDQIYQTAGATDNNLSISGSVGKALPYRLSAGYLNQEGILKTSKLERTTLGLNLNPTFLDNHLKVDLSLKGSQSKSRYADQGAVGNAVLFDPTQPVYSGDDSMYGGYYEWTDASSVNGLRANSPRNPLGMLEEREDRSKVERSIGSLQLDYKLHFLPDLHVVLNGGYDVSRGTGTIYVPEYAASNYKRFKNADDVLYSGVNNQYKQTQTNLTFEGYLRYVKDFKSIDSKLEAIGGYAYYDYKTTNYNFGDYSADGVLRDQSAPVYPFDTQHNRLISYYGRMNYTFKDKYVLTATVRSDGSARFSPLTRFATFPSVAFAWRMKEESFLQNVSALSDLKLRVGYGVTGQQDGIGNFQYLSYYNLSSNTAQYQLGDTFYNMYRPGGYAPDRKWESTATTNIAIDYGLLNGRVNGSLEFYYKKTKDLLNTIPQPAGTNFSNEFTINIGDMENKGVEFNINGDIIKRRDLNWNVGFNVTYNQNKITRLTLSDDPNYPGATFGNPSRGTGNYVQIHSVGFPRGAFYVLQQVYGEDGNPVDGLFVDRNGDGVINVSDSYRYKQPDPKTYFGLSSSLTYKRWSAGFVARASLGNYLYNDVAANTGVKVNVLNKLNFINNASRSILASGITGNVSGDKYFLSDYYVENASYFRMDNINLGYNFGKVLGSRGNLRMSANVQNVFVITDYTGLDPENTGGIDRNFYPRPRTYTLGLNLNF